MIERVLSYSGGKDSTALYLLALEHGKPFTPVFADTGHEHEATYDYVRDLPRKTGGPQIRWVKADFSSRFESKRKFIAEKWPMHGVPADRVERALSVLHPTGNPFVDLVMLKGRFPSMKTRFCSEELKLVPIFNEVTAPLARAGATVVSWQGVRAEESLARSTLPMRQRVSLAPYCLKKHERDEAEAWRSYAFRPLIRWTRDEVFAFHRRHGIEPNPLYAEGMTRVGCMPCINCSKNELAQIAARFPEHIARVKEWEIIASQASKRGSTTFFNAVNDPTYVEGEHVTHENFGIDRHVAWAQTARGGRQLDLGLMADSMTECNAWGTCE